MAVPRKSKRRKPQPRQPPYTPCGQCLAGWVTVVSKSRHWSVKRCWCFVAHQAKLAEKVDV